MMDLWAIVPYYDAYLCEALKRENVSVTLGAITYYLDPGCFARRNLHNAPGLMDIVGRFKLPKRLRQPLKLLETGINMVALAVRFIFSRPEIIHVQYLPMLSWHLPFDFWFLRYCRLRGSQLICTVHDILPSDTGEKHKEIFRRLYAMMNALICHSEPVREELVNRFGIARKKIWVIPHGPFFFDAPRSSAPEVRNKLGVQAGQILVLWQGIIRPYKGIDFLLDAWSEVQQAGANARLLIAGAGDPTLLAAIRDKVNSLAVQNSVEEMLSYYQAADIVVYPYKTVTTSGALMTGITQGKAIVATRLAPFNDLLQDGQNALLCDYGDPSQLARAILLLITDSALRAKLASKAAALNLGEQMWKQIAAQTATCYAAVCGRAPGTESVSNAKV
jgi:glycosyltransferase involved in cell wall biosynthesis